ncbi:beta-lactamase family protein [Streptomyces sp. A1136]|uniref:beta-lactamase family protein n=1 Tax=Streptomyces sp. A1136 TaxID=2563102 RepID=UPI00109EB024|nr:beta-lactamase family protein [Streptomyces sp. A1136]THA56657.1 hypothetical protein E6R62_10635 [Streptomyces sp. A1136]
MTVRNEQADPAGRDEEPQAWERALARTAGPGAVWAVGDADGVRAAGSDQEAALDVDGLAAVLAVWPVIGDLVARGDLALHTPLSAYGPLGVAPVASRDPAFQGTGAPDGITAHHLLTRPGGVPLLTRLAEHLCGGPLAEYAPARIWRPLGMTRTRLTGLGLHTTGADLARFLRHLLSAADHPVPRTWTAESLRIRTGELVPARGLLWRPAPSGVWSHGDGPAVWVSPRLPRWAVLVPAAPAAPGGPPPTAFRETAFAARRPPAAGPLP